MKPFALLPILLCNLLFLSTAAHSTNLKLDVDQWVHLPKGQTTGPSIEEDWKGKVIYLYFFQSWCPGCHSSGFPTLQTLLKKYGDNDQVEFAAVQTVFEGFHTNTPQAAKRIVERYKLHAIPVGQSGTPHKESVVMEDFKTRGTPWTVIIDPKGNVVYSHFHLKADKGSQLIDQLLETL